MLKERPACAVFDWRGVLEIFSLNELPLALASGAKELNNLLALAKGDLAKANFILGIQSSS